MQHHEQQLHVQQ